MRKFYVAASFAYKDREKTEDRKKNIDRIVDYLQGLNSADSFFIPHHLQIPHAWDLSLEEWAKKVFEHDFKALDEADIVLFISWGKENNSGSVWETGYAYAKGKPVIVIKMNNDVESLMITNTARAFLKEDDIWNYDWVGLPTQKIMLTEIS